MVGKIYKSLTPFYNSYTNKNGFKGRPVLIIGQSDTTDYVVLPISRITRKEHVHPVYDVRVTMADHPNLHLNADSYVRTHKQTTINRADIADVISDLKTEYEDLYIEILSKREEFNKYITDSAIR